MKLTEDALVDILTKPRNALIKQYQKLFEMDGVSSALPKARSRPFRRRRSRRGAGRVDCGPSSKNILLETMYEIPSHPNIKEVLVSEEVVEQNQQPLRIYHQKTPRRPGRFFRRRGLCLPFAMTDTPKRKSTSPAATAGFAKRRKNDASSAATKPTEPVAAIRFRMSRASVTTCESCGWNVGCRWPSWPSGAK